MKDVVNTLVPQEEEDMSICDAVDTWSGANLSFPEQSKQNRQDAWDAIIIQRATDSLLEMTKTDFQSSARMKSLMCAEAGVWLNAIPSPQLGTFLDNDSLRIAVGLRLGTQICLHHTCGAHVDSSGLHGLSCKKSAGRWSRHHALNETVRRAIEATGMPARLEPVGTSRDDGKRPDGMSLFPWKEGRLLVWDATCTDNMAPSYIKKHPHHQDLLQQLRN